VILNHAIAAAVIHGPSRRILERKVMANPISLFVPCRERSNTVQSNRINGSDESVIHVDSSCGPVTNNVVSGNTINEACAGILVGNAAGPNSIGSNTFFNARNTVLTADRCTLLLIAARSANTLSVNTSSVAKSPRLSPARP
jgi:hypothetical protein